MRRAAGAGLALALGLVAAFSIAPGAVERRFNRVTPRTPRPPSARARELHRRLTIVDLHADSLLWGRDLNERSRRGHVDVPRLIEGNVAVQAFTVVTKTPRNINVHRNSDESDNVTLLALALRWPPRTWGSLKERALYQAALLQRFAARSEGRLQVLRTADDVARYRERRRLEPRITAAFLGLEGAQALTDPTDLDALFDAGFRMIAFAHFFDTAWAGSAHGVSKGGLTDKGRALLGRMEEKRILLDLAHASAPAIADALAVARRPVVVSHTGVKGTCDNARNLSDAQLRGVAATGGVVGIGFWSGATDGAVCGSEPGDIARAIGHAVRVAGVDHVGLGSDWDGAVTVPFDAAGLAELTDALLAAGLGEDEIAKVMGGNALRVLASALE